MVETKEISSTEDNGTSRRIRVMHLLNTEVRGGIEEGVLSLLRNLNRERFATALACPRRLIDAYGHDLDELGVDVYSIPAVSRPYDIGGMLRLARVLRSAAPDVLHTHLFTMSLCAAPLAKAYGVRVVIESCRIREGWRRGIWKHHFVDRLVNRCVDVNIAISESLKRYLVEEKGFPARKVVLIRNGRELSRVVAAPRRDAAALRNELGLDSRGPVIVVPARLEFPKGHRHLLDALPKVIENYPNLSVVLVGDGSLRMEIESQIARLALREHVCMTGYRRDVYDLVRLGDLVVLPSLFEGLPLAAIEAGALGKAIVATSVDGTPEVVLHGKTGWLVPPANPDELASGICKLLADDELRNQMGARAREYVTQEYSFDRLVDQTEQLYARLCEPFIH